MKGRRVSKMVEDYLKIIWKAQEWPDGSVSTNEIAETLAVTLREHQPHPRRPRDRRHGRAASSCSRDLPGGAPGARLGRGPCGADSLEHAVSDFVLDRMDQVLGHPACDPHGDRIPRADGSIERSMERNSAARLSEIDPGAHGRVIRISDHEPEILQYLEDRQISVGTYLHLHERNPAVGSVSISRSSAPSEHADRVEIAIGAAGAVWVSVDPSHLDSL